MFIRWNNATQSFEQALRCGEDQLLRVLKPWVQAFLFHNYPYERCAYNRNPSRVKDC
jgi:hypothetical protein